MRRHMYTRAILAVLLAAVGIIGLNPLFLVLGGVFGYSAYSLWKREQENRDDSEDRRGEGRRS